MATARPRPQVMRLTDAAAMRIKEVMAYSGKRLLLMGRLDLLWHYFF